METWEVSWELEFPATNPDELLQALVVRDLLHGSSYDVDVDEKGSAIAVDFTAGDELDGEVYRLLITAEVEGPQDQNLVREVSEEILEDLLEEAEELVAHRQDLGTIARSLVKFQPVPEDEERWSLVVPDWLAPDEAEVPFGFRSFLAETGEPWPGDDLIDRHGRVVLVPFGTQLRLFGVPAPKPSEEPDTHQH